LERVAPKVLVPGVSLMAAALVRAAAAEERVDQARPENAPAALALPERAAPELVALPAVPVAVESSVAAGASDVWAVPLSADEPDALRAADESAVSWEMKAAEARLPQVQARPLQEREVKRIRSRADGVVLGVDVRPDGRPDRPLRAVLGAPLRLQ